MNGTDSATVADRCLANGTGDDYRVQYDDGDREWTTIMAVRTAD